jgi:hypothetical protein
MERIIGRRVRTLWIQSTLPPLSVSFVHSYGPIEWSVNIELVARKFNDHVSTLNVDETRLRLRCAAHPLHAALLPPLLMLLLHL